MKSPMRFLGSGFGSTLAVSEFVSVRFADRQEFYGLAVHEKDILKIDGHTAPFLFQQATIDPPCSDPSSVPVVRFFGLRLFPSKQVRIAGDQPRAALIS
jgi:hypothetical protein